MRGSGIFKGHGGLIQSRWRLLPPMVSYRLDGGAGIGKTNRGDGIAGKYLSGRVPLDKREGVVKAQNCLAVLFAPRDRQSG